MFSEAWCRNSWKFLEDSTSDVRIAKESKLKNDNKTQIRRKYYLLLTTTSFGFLHRLISYAYFSRPVHKRIIAFHFSCFSFNKHVLGARNAFQAERRIYRKTMVLRLCLVPGKGRIAI